MRVNVYAEEIAVPQFDLVIEQKTGRGLLGIRIYLESPECLQPPAHQDDDRSAVTFWFKTPKAAWDFTQQMVDIIRPAVPGDA